MPLSSNLQVAPRALATSQLGALVPTSNSSQSPRVSSPVPPSYDDQALTAIQSLANDGDAYNKWHRTVWDLYELQAAQYPLHETVHIEGPDIPSLGRALISALAWDCKYPNASHEHSYYADDVELPVFPPHVVCFPAPLLSYFKAEYERSYRIRGATANTIGRGLERSVIRNAIHQMVDDSAYWTSIGPWRVPSFCLHDEPSADRLALWEASGILCAMHLIYYGSAPFPVSPFFLLLMLGKDEFDKLDDIAVTAFDAESSEKLRPWLTRTSSDDPPLDLRSEFWQTVIMHAELDVRPCSCY